MSKRKQMNFQDAPCTKTQKLTQNGRLCLKHFVVHSLDRTYKYEKSTDRMRRVKFYRTTCPPKHTHKSFVKLRNTSSGTFAPTCAVRPPGVVYSLYCLADCCGC